MGHGSRGSKVSSLMGQMGHGLTSMLAAVGCDLELRCTATYGQVMLICLFYFLLERLSDSLDNIVTIVEQMLASMQRLMNNVSCCVC